MDMYHITVVFRSENLELFDSIGDQAFQKYRVQPSEIFTWKNKRHFKSEQLPKMIMKNKKIH